MTVVNNIDLSKIENETNAELIYNEKYSNDGIKHAHAETWQAYATVDNELVRVIYGFTSKEISDELDSYPWNDEHIIDAEIIDDVAQIYSITKGYPELNNGLSAEKQVHKLDFSR